MPGDQYSGVLVRYVQSQFLHCKDIGKRYSQYTPQSLDAYLASPFFGERPEPVKNPRPSRGKTERSSIETVESSEDSHVVYDDELLAIDTNLILNHSSASDPQLPEAVYRLNRHESRLKKARTWTQETTESAEVESANIVDDCPFEEGTFVRVMARTAPGVSERESVSFVAKFLRRVDITCCYVVPLVENQRKKKVLFSRLEAYSFDGLDSLSRIGKPSAHAIKLVTEAERDRRTAIKDKQRVEVEAAREAKRARSEIKKVTKAAEVRVRRARRMAKASVEAFRAKLKIAVAAAVLGKKQEHMAKEELISFRTKAKLAAARMVRRTAAQCNFAAKKKAMSLKQRSRKEIKTYVEAARRAELAATTATADAAELRNGRAAWTRKQVKDFKARGRTQDRIAFDDAAVTNRRLEATLEHEL
jgi:hypothetical protein